MKKSTSNKFFKTMIATGIALSFLSTSLASLNKYKNPKKSWFYTGLALSNITCVGAWIWMKNKSKQK